MKSFRYTIKSEAGIHARPAGLLVKEAQKYKSKVEILADGKVADATRLMALLALGIRRGQNVELCIQGEDEEAAYVGIRNFFEQNL